MSFEDMAKIKCPDCGVPDAYFSFVGGIALSAPARNGGLKTLAFKPDFSLPGATLCRHCLKNCLPKVKVDSVTLSLTVDL